MNHILIQAMMLRNYSIIVPFSGGVESTALVYHLKTTGYDPYCFHIKANPGEVNTIQQKAKLLDVKVVTVQTDYNPHEGYLFNREASHEHYKNTFNYDACINRGSSPRDSYPRTLCGGAALLLRGEC